MTQKTIEIGKTLTHYVLTSFFAAVGVYVGLRITLAEMKKDIEYTKTTASRNADYIEEIKPSISVLCYMHGLGIRSGNENRHNHTLPGKD
jgi:hypothetical protein